MHAPSVLSRAGSALTGAVEVIGQRRCHEEIRQIRLVNAPKNTDNQLGDHCKFVRSKVEPVAHTLHGAQCVGECTARPLGLLLCVKPAYNPGVKRQLTLQAHSIHR